MPLHGDETLWAPVRAPIACGTVKSDSLLRAGGVVVLRLSRACQCLWRVTTKLRQTKLKKIVEFLNFPEFSKGFHDLHVGKSWKI